MKPAPSKLAKRWGLPRPIIKSHAEEKWAWPWAREAPKNLGFFLTIYAIAESIEFKFGTQSGWPISPIIKSHK